MKKIALGIIICITSAYSSSNIFINSGIKDYKNSKTKVDGKFYKVGVGHKYKSAKISFNHSEDKVKREHPVTKKSIDELIVEKYNLNYDYMVNKNLTLKSNYIKIIDNLAPTDQGKIFGFGADYNLYKGITLGSKYYKSDYKDFNVDQFDLSISKKFKIKDLKSKISIILKNIDVNGDKYKNYIFKDKDYLTTQFKLNTNYHNYIGELSVFFGKRLFSVLNDGKSVQHHAMEQEKTYSIKLGKKFKSFDMVLSHLYQKGNELPENRNDVQQRITAFMLKYKF